MHKSKLITTLQLFTRQEISRLQEFLQSPYFYSEKERNQILPLYQHILAHYGNWNHPNLSKSHTLTVIYSKESGSTIKLEKLMSKLQQCIHKFIAIEYQSNKDSLVEDSIATIHFFRKHGKFNIADHQLAKAKKNQTSKKIKDSIYYLNEFKLNRDFFLDDALKSKTPEKNSFGVAQEPLDIYYLLHKLEYACTLLSFSRFRKPIDLDKITQFLENVKPIYAQSGILEVPILKTYYYTFEILRKPDFAKEDYSNLKLMIQKYTNVIPKKTLIILKSLLRNLIIRAFNRGATELASEIFENQKIDLASGFLSTETGILPSTFKNIVTMGLRAKDFVWVDNFLEKYKDKIIGAKSSKEIYNYNRACYYFEQKKYDEALALLNDQYVDIFYKNATKRLELKILYETNSEILDSKIDAFKIYIYRLSEKSILHHKREGNNNFINFLRQLRNPKSTFSQTRKDKLKAKIKECKFITEQIWLLDKISSNK